MLDSKSHTIENNFRRNKEKNLVRFADNWNDGIPPWRDGMMGSGLRLVEPKARRGYCNVGLMGIIVLTIKLKMDNILLKNPLFSPRRRLHRLYEPEAIVPLFHYSIVETKTQASKNLLYFHQVVKIPERIIMWPPPMGK